jgi:hypothetical protein
MLMCTARKPILRVADRLACRNDVICKQLEIVLRNENARKLEVSVSLTLEQIQQIQVSE